MMLFRYIAHAVVIPALLAGCTQSLFDAGGDGDRRDGAPRPDARTGDGGMMGQMDGGGGVDDPDGGRPPDAGPPRPTCPGPCAGDAYAEYSGQQASMVGWNYVEYRADQPENEFSGMAMDAVAGWRGTGLSFEMAPTVTYCDETATAPLCAGLLGTLALTSNSSELEAHHPGLQWRPSMAGIYRISGTWQVAANAPESAVIMTIARNTQSEVLLSETLILTDTPYEFSVTAELAVTQTTRDRIVLRAATTELPISVGVNLFITGPLPTTDAGVW
jgi:hypothetical protein